MCMSKFNSSGTPRKVRNMPLGLIFEYSYTYVSVRCDESVCPQKCPVIGGWKSKTKVLGRRRASHLKCELLKQISLSPLTSINKEYHGISDVAPGWKTPTRHPVPESPSEGVFLNLGQSFGNPLQQSYEIFWHFIWHSVFTSAPRKRTKESLLNLEPPLSSVWSARHPMPPWLPPRSPCFVAPRLPLTVSPPGTSASLWWYHQLLVKISLSLWVLFWSIWVGEGFGVALLFLRHGAHTHASPPSPSNLTTLPLSPPLSEPHIFDRFGITAHQHTERGSAIVNWTPCLSIPPNHKSTETPTDR